MDLRYEFYPAPGETVSLGAFYKHFRNPIEWTYIDMGGSLRYMYENADRAQSWGVELDVRKNLGFIGMPNLSLVLNAAWIYSNVTFVPGEVVSGTRPAHAGTVALRDKRGTLLQFRTTPDSTWRCSTTGLASG